MKLKPSKNDKEPIVLNRDTIKSKKVEIFPAESKTTSHIPILPEATSLHSYLKKYTNIFLREQSLFLTHDFVPSRYLLKTEDIYNH